MATTQGNGVIYDRPDATLLDTRELQWEEFPGLKGCKLKTLSRFPDGHAQVFLVGMPPGSLHGHEPGPESATGCLILFGRNGIGDWLDDPNAAEESPDVPYPA